MLKETVSFVIFILLDIASFSDNSKTGENGNLKLPLFEMPISTLSYDIYPKVVIADRAKLGQTPNLCSDFEEYLNFEILSD